jgi:Transposase zinc-binding domain
VNHLAATIAYKSCRNRHCQNARPSSTEMLAEREAELLPAPYFYVVFTLPAGIASVAYQNKKVVSRASHLVYLQNNPKVGNDMQHAAESFRQFSCRAIPHSIAAKWPIFILWPICNKQPK